MCRAPRTATVALLLVSLLAAHGGSGLSRALSDAGDGSYCCCPSPAECRCTANCCSHGPTAAEPVDGLSARSSVSCHFPQLPDGSLATASSHESPADAVARQLHPLTLPDLLAGRIESSVSRRGDFPCSASSPRAPPPPDRIVC